MKNITLYGGFASPLTMFWISAAFFWPLRYAEIMMDSLWPKNLQMLNSPDRGYHCHEIGGTEYWMW